MIHIPFKNRYVDLGDAFYVKTRPTPVARPSLIRFNDELAQAMGVSIDASAGDRVAEELAAVFSGNVIPEGAEPLAMAYSGHQFGYLSPQLGDGRAILLGETGGDGGACFDVQLKGSGPTYYSRGGDGRAALGPVLREYLVSEAMARLNVPTTRALAAVATGEPVMREQVLPGGVITRVASSFVRVGTFQFFAARGDADSIRKLADYVIERNYPQLAAAENPYAALLEVVIERQARLIAQWMQLGFIHGVMNTDNVSIAGETIDYGPCAFMDAYAHDRVYSSIDRDGRYAYNNQPGIGLWNLTRLAESLLPLLAEEPGEAVEIAQALLTEYPARYEAEWLSGMRAKCGLTDQGNEEEDRSLIESLLNTMAENNADFTLTFHYLSRPGAQSPDHNEDGRALFDEPAQFDDWLARWRKRLSLETGSDEARQRRMQAVNPVYIPRNHQIEAAIRAAEDNGDLSVFHELHQVLQNPFEMQAGKEHYLVPPQPEEVVEYTFCGT